MKKIKEYMKEIEIKKVLKNCCISICTLYFILNILYLIPTIKDYSSLGKELEKFEEYLIISEEGIKNNSLKENDDYFLSKMEIKYPGAVYALTEKCGVFGELINNLYISIFTGTFIGIALYMYSKSKNIIKLIIGYLIMVVIIFCISELIVGSHTMFGIDFGDKGGFYFGGQWGYDMPIIVVVFITIILVIIKFIKNKVIAKKLNELL